MGVVLSWCNVCAKHNVTPRNRGLPTSDGGRRYNTDSHVAARSAVAAASVAGAYRSCVKIDVYLTVILS